MYLIFLNYTLLIGGENTWGISHRDMVNIMYAQIIVAIEPSQLLLDTCTCHVMVWNFLGTFTGIIISSTWTLLLCSIIV